jgi:hypothetical protein
MTSEPNTQINLNELEGNIGESTIEANKVKGLVETNKPTEQTKAAFGYLFVGLDA